MQYTPNLHLCQMEAQDWMNPNSRQEINNSFLTLDRAVVEGRKFGAQRLLTSSSPALTRLWDAVGKTAAVSTGAGQADNDFDDIYPWSEMRVCNIEIVDNEIVVKSYKGDLDFEADGSNGQVAVEIPAFYWCPANLYAGYETYGVSDHAIAGWVYSPKRYISAYLANADGATKVGSWSGVSPLFPVSLSGFRQKAQATDSVCQVMDMDDWNAVASLFCVEFATLNSQSIMYGCAGMNNAYNQEHTISSVTSDTVFDCDDADKYTVGQAIAIGTSKNGAQRTAWVEIADITGTTITLKTAVSNLAVGDYISTRAWVNGNADEVPVSGQILADNKHPMKYRGLENFWGCMFQWIDGVLIDDHKPYVCDDKTKFASTVTSDYEQLSYLCGDTNGYMSAYGFDHNKPQVRFPTSVADGSSSKYWCDYYYQNTGLRGCYFGGYWNYTADAGLFSFHVHYAPTSTYFNLGSRLSWKTT